jgi:hypothetical protein
MRTTLRVLLLTGVAAFTTTMMKGQQTAATPFHTSHQEVDLALTYAALHSNLTTGTNFWQQGGTVELSAEVYRGLGVVANIAGGRASNINNTGVNLTTVTTTFGPRYTWSPRHRKLALFGQGLFGEAHGLDSIFPSITGATTTDFNAFALQTGGGFDLRLWHHFAVRPIEADWLRTQFPNGTTNVQNNLRLEGGIVLRFPQ